MEVLPTAGAMQLNRMVGAYSNAMVLVATYHVLSLLVYPRTAQGLEMLTLTAALEAL